MKRSRELGQYFTPEPVVELCYRILRTLDPETRSPSIIDPACGEGAFLSYALAHEITTTDRLFGIEKDVEVAASWEHSIGDLPNLRIGDGLCTLSPRLPRVTTERSVSRGFPFSHSPTLPLAPSPTLRLAFDWVVGNPPFGTGCLRGEPNLECLKRVVEDRFSIWRGRPTRRPLDLRTFPVEILFLERFLQLAKPGGMVAIIVPDGILANARLAYAREWLADRAEIKAVVSLPNHLFQRGGALSKSSLLMFRRHSSLITHHASVLMAALESRAPIREAIPHLAKLLASFVHNNSALRTPHFALRTPWDVFMIESPAPGDRLDPAYHHPKYLENVESLRRLPGVVPFGELIEYTSYGAVGRRELSDTGVRLITPANFVMTEDGYVSGLDMRNPERFVSPGSWNDPLRSRLRKGDLLFVNSGVGCIGRVAVFSSDEPCNVSQHVNVIRVKEIEPEYLAVYLQTRFARLQIAREKCGVGACGISFDRIKSLLIAVPPPEVRVEIAEEYKRSPDRIRALVEKVEDWTKKEARPRSEQA